MQHGPYLLPAEDDGQFFSTCNGRKVQMLVGQSFCLEQKAQSVHRVFKIGLGRGVAAPLQFVEIIFYLFAIELGRQALEVKSHSCYMAAIVVECAGAPAQDGDVAFKAFKQCFKAINFATGTVEVLVIP